MTFEEYRKYDGLGLAKLIRKREVTATELVEVAVTRAESVNPTINAIIHPLYDMAKEMAKNADPESPFAGIPFLVKDLGLEIAGAPLSAGSRGYRDYVSKEDSYIVERFRQAGLSFLGKTNTPEFGTTPYTEPKHFGPTRNPWNIGRTAGGSSGGSAAAVAAGITPLASASDGGGSIRIPASCCGLFGLKPSRGRISLGPGRGEGWSGAVMEHCVSRSVRDSAALLDAIQGPAPGEPFIIQPPEKPYLETLKEAPGRLRIGMSTAHTLGQEVEAECILAVEKTAKLLESLGHHVELAPLPYRREDLTETFLTVICGEVAAGVDELSEHLGRTARPGDVERTNFALAMLGRNFSAGDYAYQRRKWNDISRRLGAFHQQYDLLLTPTVSRVPFRIGELQPSDAEQRLLKLVTSLNLEGVLKARIGPLAEKIFSYIPYTALGNMAGQPSMSVPLHWSEDGLPVGVMFTGPVGREDMLFRLAAQLEEAQPWMKKAPEV